MTTTLLLSITCLIIGEASVAVTEFAPTPLPCAASGVFVGGWKVGTGVGVGNTGH